MPIAILAVKIDIFEKDTYPPGSDHVIPGRLFPVR